MRTIKIESLLIPKHDEVSDDISEDKTLTLKNYLLSDINLVRKASTKEYVLTYTDGRKEYFDGTYGCITKIEDRFGNLIIFEYKVLEYYQGSFTDYIFNPSFYSEKLNTLSRIIDSAGRIIDIDYRIANSLTGQQISQINFKMSNKYYATLNLANVKSYNGNIDILESIVVGDMQTFFEYEEIITHIYQNAINEGPLYTVNGSTFALKKVKYPTGGHTEYEYEKARRSYMYYVPDTVLTDWYEVYKVSKRRDSALDEITYSYENDYSGYPFSALSTDVYSYNPTGYIIDSSVKYHTIEKHNGLTKIYTFNYRHNKISEQIYDDKSTINSYISSKGDAKWNVVVNNIIYRVGISENKLYFYSTPTDCGEPTFLKPLDFDSHLTISNVKTKGNIIYVFYKDGNKLIAKSFDTINNTWSVENDEYDSTIGSSMSLTNMYYSNGIFFSYYMNKVSNEIYHVIYDPTKSIGSRWKLNQVHMYVSQYSFSFICSNGNKIYYKSYNEIYEYDLSTNTFVEKSFPLLDINDSVKGFVVNGKTYLYTHNYLYEFNFTDCTLPTSYNYPFEINTYDTLQKGTDGNLYYFNGYNSNNDYQYIYRFNPTATTPWQLVSYKLFENSNTSIIMGNNEAYLTIGNNSGLDSYGNVQKNYGGFEKVKLGIDAQDKSRTRTDYTYDGYNQLRQRNLTSLGNNTRRIDGTETWTYVNSKNILTSYTDVLGNKTTYEYTNSTYYLPTKITKYADTDNELVITNILSTDNKKITSINTAYDDRNVITSYTYNSIYPGDVHTETLQEQKNSVTDTLNTIEYAYDSSGVFVTQKTYKNIITNDTDFNYGLPKDISTSYTYNNLGLLESETNAKNETTRYEYNNNGWRTKVVKPDNTFISTTYEFFNVDEKNIITTSYNDQYYTIDYFDDLGRIIKQSDKGTNTTEKTLSSYQYSGSRLFRKIDAKSNKTDYYYDSFDRIASMKVFDSNNQIVSTKTINYDDFNHKKTEDIGGSVNCSFYDVAGRLKKTEVNSEEGLCTAQYEYDYMGNVNKKIDPLNGVTQFIYNDMGQLFKVKNALNEETNIEYDSMGNKSKIISAGGSITLNEYDKLGRLLKRINSLGGAEHFSYDDVGYLTASKDRKDQSSSYVYKPNTGLLEQFTTGDISINYTYDDFGNKISMTDNTGTTNYSYKYNNMLESIKTPDNKTISYNYDDNGNISSVKDYNGQTLSYTYDGANRIDKINKSDITIADYDYTNNGLIDKVTYPEGKTQYTYDNAMRMITSVNSLTNGTVLNNFHYYYDLNGNMRSKTDNENESIYSYDALNRLNSEYEPDGTNTNYIFDKNNNIITKTINHPADFTYSFKQDGVDHNISQISTHEINYAYDTNNRLLQECENIGGASNNYSGMLEIQKSYDYDANGNLLKVEKGGQIDPEVLEYTYNSLNKLTQYKDAHNNITSYKYDGNGMRTSKSSNGININYYWDRGYISNEADNNNFTATNFIGAGGIFARQEGSATNYMFKNGHGDVVSLVSSGVVTKTYNYNAYGVEKNIDANDNNPFRYCGEYWDKETSTIYLRTRNYDPSIGRFTQEDPARAEMNWYIYANNNPILYVDPSGLVSVVFVAPGMEDQADVRAEYYTEQYGTESYVFEIDSAENFIEKWNSYFKTAKRAGITIDAIEVISHGGASGDVGKDESGTAYATSYMIFGSSRVFARDNDNMSSNDRSLDSISSVIAKEINVNSCNSANKDVYNVVYGFMQNVDAKVYSGFDGGAKWDAKVGDHVRGDGEYGRNLAHPFDPTYYVRNYQATWWKYVGKNADGSPVRSREGRRTFYK